MKHLVLLFFLMSCLKHSDLLLSTTFRHILCAKNFSSNIKSLLPLPSCPGLLRGAVSQLWEFFLFFFLHICQHLFHDFILTSPLYLLPPDTKKMPNDSIFSCLFLTTKLFYVDFYFDILIF